MRNLKRALSLVMASAMLIGMMVVGASAANFSDSEKIANTDAVTMVSELGIINGMPDGSYQPEANIDRASMAKMICVALNGGKDPQLGAGAVNSYTDTVGNWAAGYIEYCTSLGIVAGKGDKLFAPSANVTVSEAAKMLLVALGYNAEAEGLVGATWQTKTDVLANQVGLYDGFVALTSSNLTRDNAAQMVYNALNASVVKYDGGKAVAQTTSSYEWITSPDGNTTTAVTKEIEKTLLADKFKVTETTGIVTANEFGALVGSVQDEGVSVIGGTSYNLTTDAELLGQKVTIYVRDTKTDGRANVTGGAVPTDDCKVVVTSAKKTAAKLTELIEKDNKMAVDASTKYSVNYAVADTTAITANAAGQELRIIDNNNDGKVDYMIQVTYNFGKVTRYSTKDDGSIAVRVAAGTLTKNDAEDVVGFDDVKKDDYVLAAEIGGKLYVEKAESVSGNLDRAKVGDTLTVDGKAYKVSGLTPFTDGGDIQLASTYADTGVSATFYLDKKGNIVAVGDPEEGESNYAVIIGFAKSGNSLDSSRVKLLLTDGTTITRTVKKFEKWDGDSWEKHEPADEDAVKGKVATYTENSSSEVTVRLAHTDNSFGKDLTYAEYTTATSGKYQFTKGKTAVTVGTDDHYFANSSTIFFYMNEDGDGADIYTGHANAPTVDFDGTTGKATTYSAILDGTTLKALVVNNVKADAAGDYLYLVNYLGKDSDNSYFDAVIDGEVVENIAVADTDLNADSYGLYEYTVNADGEYDLDTKISASKDAYVVGLVGKVSGNSVFVGGTAAANEYLLTNNSVVVMIDGSDSYSGATVAKNDYVIMVKDDTDVETLFIVTAYDEDDFGITVTAEGTAAGVAVNGTAISVPEGTTGTQLDGYFAAKSGYTITCGKTDAAVTASDKVTVTNTKTSAKMEYTIELVAAPTGD